MIVAELTELVNEAIVIDKRMKDDKKNLDELKAKLQAAALVEMDNKNVKYIQIFGTNGTFTATYKEKLDIDDHTNLVLLLGDIANSKITRSAVIKYEIDSRFKQALLALYNDDYSDEITVTQVLVGLKINDKAIKLAEKKLKGDYLKDKMVLESVGCKGELEEELDAIRRYYNWINVEQFFSALSLAQRNLLKKTIFVDNQLAAGLEYAK